MVQIKRIYDPPADDDGRRVLADRLWPRGISKDEADVDEWVKDVTPSTELRKWYHEDPQTRHAEFVRRYERELAGPEQQAGLTQLRDLAAHGTVTLLTSSKDLPHSHLAVLADVLSH
ncbi:uncharacterized protein YeaO (DUF488 family) [Hamadaea flava]|uniref:DUF488 domain-containing protein n=1 Tax=Hamadaea flava TaxID=1742688 RepID=A0ABV8LYK0_9ACTN|nr:DUF488 family protein [Hamadaea flava]MCP2329052.1 uncharacterized protein YeaO (DUF488 family) [Hamadaea flava]